MKKFFSLVLALVMALSLTTVAWGAMAGADLQTAIAGVDTYTLTDDVTADTVILIDHDIFIDGAGKTLTTSATRAFRITNSDVTVTVKNLNVVSTSTVADSRGFSIDATNGSGDVTGVSLTLNNCSVEFTADDCGYAVNLGGGDDHIVTINGGSYEGLNAINVWGDDHVITIDGATLTSIYPESSTYVGAGVRIEGEGVQLTVKDTTYKGDNAVNVSEETSGANTLVESGNTNEMPLQLLANGEVDVNPSSTAAGVAPILYAWDNAGTEWDAYFIATGADMDDLKQDASDNCLPCYLIDGEYFVVAKEAAATFKLVYGNKTVFLAPVDASDVCYEAKASVYSNVTKKTDVCGKLVITDTTATYYASYDEDLETYTYYVGTKNGSKQILVNGKIVDVELNAVQALTAHVWNGYDVVDHEYTTAKCANCGKVAKLYATGTAAGKGYHYEAGLGYITKADNDFGPSVSAPSTDKTVTSAKTFDAGIAMYVGMSVMAAAGSAVVIGKKKD